MGDRSDRDYNGFNDSGDWKKGTSKNDSRYPFKTWEQQTASLPSSSAPRALQARAVLDTQLPRFRNEGGRLVRTWENTGAGLAIMTLDSSTGVYDLFTRGGLSLSEVECTCNGIPSMDTYRNLQQVAEHIVRENQATGRVAYKVGIVTRKLNKLSLTVCLTPEQMNTLKNSYEALAGSKSPQAGRGPT